MVISQKRTRNFETSSLSPSRVKDLLKTADYLLKSAVYPLPHVISLSPCKGFIFHSLRWQDLLKVGNEPGIPATSTLTGILPGH